MGAISDPAQAIDAALEIIERDYAYTTLGSADRGWRE